MTEEKRREEKKRTHKDRYHHFNVSIVCITNECFMWFWMYRFLFAIVTNRALIEDLRVFFSLCDSLSIPALFFSYIYIGGIFPSERFITCYTMTSLQIIQWEDERNRSSRCEKCLLWKLIWCVNTHGAIKRRGKRRRRRCRRRRKKDDKKR